MKRKDTPVWETEAHERNRDGDDDLSWGLLTVLTLRAGAVKASVRGKDTYPRLSHYDFAVADWMYQSYEAGGAFSVPDEIDM